MAAFAHVNAYGFFPFALLSLFAGTVIAGTVDGQYYYFVLEMGTWPQHYHISIDI